MESIVWDGGAGWIGFRRERFSFSSSTYVTTYICNTAILGPGRPVGDEQFRCTYSSMYWSRCCSSNDSPQIHVNESKGGEQLFWYRKSGDGIRTTDTRKRRGARRSRLLTLLTCMWPINGLGMPADLMDPTPSASVRTYMHLSLYIHTPYGRAC